MDDLLELEIFRVNPAIDDSAAGFIRRTICSRLHRVERERSACSRTQDVQARSCSSASMIWNRVVWEMRCLSKMELRGVAVLDQAFLHGLPFG